MTKTSVRMGYLFTFRKITESQYNLYIVSALSKLAMSILRRAQQIVGFINSKHSESWYR